MHICVYKSKIYEREGEQAKELKAKERTRKREDLRKRWEKEAENEMKEGGREVNGRGK